MELHTLEYIPGSRGQKNKRVGRGHGSGMGKTSTRGSNGQKSRKSGHTRLGFEGGQTPLYKRIPKRGFTNVNRKEYAIINVEDLNVFENGVEVTPELLVKAGLVKKVLCGIKVLGNGTLEKSLTVKCHKVSKSAQAMIEKAGGKVEVI